MIKNSLRQKGSAHVVIIVILVAVLLTVLGFVFWQNFIKKDGISQPTPVSNSTEETIKPVAYKKYVSDIYDASFQYPDTWSVGDSVNNDQEGNISRSTTVTTAGGSKVDFVFGINGLGGTCDVQETYKTIDTSSTTIPGNKAVNFSFTLQPNQDGSFNGYYGLTDYHTTIGDVQVCANTFNYVFSPTETEYGLIHFTAEKSFADLSAANTYMASDEYREIKKMITSLSY